MAGNFIKVLSSIVILLSTKAARSVAVHKSHETTLINDLLKDYNPLARPVLDCNNTVQVNISLVIVSLQELNTKLQYISVAGWIEVYWIDEHLKWDPQDYGGLDYVAISPEKMWVPSFILFNTIGQSLYEETWYKLYKVQVWNDGKTYWAPGGTLTATCNVDVWVFPFDDQICDFWFSNWVYMKDKVTLDLTAKSVSQLLKYNHNVNEQWDIIGSAANNGTGIYNSTISYPEVIFRLHLQRKPLFYVANVILVTVVLAVLVAMMFTLPVESGERISMGVTLLLAFSVFILMINSLIPETSTVIPLITLYLICFMALSSLGICETILVLYCFNHVGENPPPKYVIKFAALLGMEQKGFSNNQSIHKLNTSTENEDKNGDHLQISEESFRNDGSEEFNVHKWKALARFLDKLFFYITSVLFIILIAVFLVILPVCHSKKDINA